MAGRSLLTSVIERAISGRRQQVKSSGAQNCLSRDQPRLLNSSLNGTFFFSEPRNADQSLPFAREMISHRRCEPLMRHVNRCDRIDLRRDRSRRCASRLIHASSRNIRVLSHLRVFVYRNHRLLKRANVISVDSIVHRGYGESRQQDTFVDTSRRTFREKVDAD